MDSLGMPYIADDPIELVKCIKCGEEKKRIFAYLSRDGRNNKKYHDEKRSVWNGRTCPDCFKSVQKKRYKAMSR